MNIAFLFVAISWHPVHESLFVSGGSDGSMMFWVVGYVQCMENIVIVPTLFSTPLYLNGVS